MNTTLVMDKLNAKVKGSWFKIRYTSDVTLTASAKRAGHTCYKTTTTTCRFGINYRNLASVKAKVADGTIPADHKFTLPWGQWLPGQEGKFLCHTGKDNKYKEYVRLYTSPNKPRCQYYLDGHPISKEALMNTGLVVGSYWKNSDTVVECLTLNTANIEQIF